jgi:hypothetical protein
VGGLAGATKPYYTQLPIIPENRDQFWLDYSTTHLQEHQIFASALSSALQAYNSQNNYQSVLSVPLDPQQKGSTAIFFEQNYNDHLMFYSLLNQLGGFLPSPNYTFPFMYPNRVMDISLESFLYTEKIIHSIMFTTLNTDLGLS